MLHSMLSLWPHPVDGARGIMFSSCPFVFVCMLNEAEAFSKQIAIDCWLLFFQNEFWQHVEQSYNFVELWSCNICIGNVFIMTLCCARRRQIGA